MAAFVSASARFVNNRRNLLRNLQRFVRHVPRRATPRRGQEKARKRPALLGRAVGRDRYDAAGAAAREDDRARHAGVDRVVLADARPVARLEPGPALANDDLAAGDDLAGEHLHTETLGVRVAAVAGGAEALLVGHAATPPPS